MYELLRLPLLYPEKIFHQQRLRHVAYPSLEHCPEHMAVGVSVRLLGLVQSLYG